MEAIIWLCFMTKEEKRERNKRYYQANRDKILAQAATYREANKEKIAEYKKQHYEKNKVSILEKKRLWREENKDKVNSSKKKYYEENKEKILEHQKEYRNTNKDKINSSWKKWYNKNREKCLEYQKEYNSTPIGRARSLLHAYNFADKERNRGKGDLTAEWIVDNIFTKPCAHCGISGWEVIGCNRLDNALPHTKNNVEPCCFICNCRLQ